MADTAALKKAAAKTAKQAGGGAMGLAIESMVQTVPIGKCKVAPENPRSHRPEIEDLDAITASIEASLADGGPGILQAGICYEQSGVYYFTAGRRRLSGAKKAGMAFIPALIMEPAEAVRAGLQEQQNHVTMHPADEAKAFARELVERDAKTVANAFGVTEGHVLRRAALANLVPEVFEAFADNRIDLSQAQAWADAPRERQEATVARIGVEAGKYKVRVALNEGQVDADDRLAMFVGEEAYKAAGGVVVVPLFNPDEHNHDEEEDGPLPEPTPVWTDRELAERLAAEQLEAKTNELKAEGYSWVEHGPFFDAVRFDKRPAAKKAERVDLGCFLELKHDGKLQVHKNLAVKKGGKGPNGAKSRGDAPAPPIGNQAHLVITTAATRAVQQNLCETPEAALPLLLARMARDHFTSEGHFYSSDEVVGISMRQHDGAAADIKINGQKLSDDLEEEWRVILSGKLETAEFEIAKWTQHDQLRLLAFLVAASVSGVEQNPAADGFRRLRLAFAGRMSGLGEGSGKVSPADTWTPDAKWFANCSKAYRSELATVLDVEPADNKVGTLCAMLADKAALMGWVPPLMKTLTFGGDAVEAAKKKRAGK